MPTQPLIIKDFDQGIADSPYKGHALMRNVNIEAFPGTVIAQKQGVTAFHANTTSTFTADAGTDIMTGGSFTTTANTTGVAVTVSSTGTLPAGLSAGTNYFVIRVDQGAGTFKLATNITNADAGTAINITDNGTGTHTVTTINPGTINHIIRDGRTGNRFAHDSNGRVWYSSTLWRLLNGNTLTASAGKGLALLGTSDASATYLFVFRNALIDVANVFSDTQLGNPTWTSGWQTMNSGGGSGNSHQTINGQDGIIYYCDDRYVGSIKENSGSVFDPATGGTYTFTQDALDMPQYEIAEWLEELGTNLLIAGGTFDKIYPWDRISDSYNNPLTVPEKQVKRLKNIGGVVYILAGTWGNVYTTQGTYVRHFKKIPEYITNNSQSLSTGPITWGGIGAINGSLLFGMAVQTSGNSGIYLLYPDGRLIIDRIPSTGSTNATAILVQTTYYEIGYASGIDTIDTDMLSALEGVVQSGLYSVGTKTKLATYSVLEVQTGKPTATGGQIRISYRTDTSSSFTTLATYSTDGVAFSFKTDDIGLTDIENIQIQAEIEELVELREIRLLP